MKRGVALLLVIAMVLVGVGAVGYLVSRAAADDYDPVVLAVPRGHATGRPAAGPVAGAVLRPAAGLGAVRRHRVHDARRAAGLRPAGRRDHRHPRRPAARRRPGPAGGLAAGQPGWPGRGRLHRGRQRVVVPRRPAAPLPRRGRLRPARHRAERPRRLPQRQRHGHLPRRGPGAGDGRGGEGVRAGRPGPGPGLRPARAAPWPPTSRPRRPPATWTCCGLPWATR